MPSSRVDVRVGRKPRQAFYQAEAISEVDQKALGHIETVPHPMPVTQNDLITVLRAYGPRSYEQDIDTPWDHLLAAVRHTSSPGPTPSEPATTQ